LRDLDRKVEEPLVYLAVCLDALLADIYLADACCSGFRPLARRDGSVEASRLPLLATTSFAATLSA
jgi:hypothetical protein